MIFDYCNTISYTDHNTVTEYIKVGDYFYSTMHHTVAYEQLFQLLCESTILNSRPLDYEINIIMPSSHHEMDKTALSCASQWCEQNWRQVKTVFSSPQYI